MLLYKILEKIALLLRIGRVYTTHDIMQNLQSADDRELKEISNRLLRVIDNGLSFLRDEKNSEKDVDTLTYLRDQLHHFSGPRACALAIQEICKMKRERPEIFKQ